MVGVGLTGKIKPLNGATFPVWEDIDGQGGLRSVATIADRNTFSAAPLYCKEGMQCYVASLQCVYELAADLSTWIFFAPSPKLASQLDWYVSLAGSVNNDGKTLGAPITFDELERRLCPLGGACLLTRDITIHYAAGTYNVGMSLHFGSADGLVHQATLDWEVSVSAPIALTGVVQPQASTKTRGQLTTGAGTFVDKELIRLRTGANAGAVAYSTGLNAGPQNTFASLFNVASFAAFHNPAPAAVGDTCEVLTLLCQVFRLEVTADVRTRVVVQYAKITRAIVHGSTDATPSGDNGGNVLFAACQAVSIAGAWTSTAGGALLFSCRWPATTVTSLKGAGWCIFGMAVQGFMGISNGSAHSYGLTIDGGEIVLGVDGGTPTPYPEGSAASLTVNRSYLFGGAVEVENGPGVPGFTGAAITVLNGCRLVVGDFVETQLWGNSGAYAYGFWLEDGAYIYQRSQPFAGILLANFAIPATIGFHVGGVDFAYSDNPIMLPNANAGVLLCDSVGSPYSTTDAVFYLKNQAGNKAPANFNSFFAGPGLYRVSAYVATTTPDAGASGAPSLNVIFTDDSGVARTVAVAAPPSVTAAGGAGGEVIIESNAAIAAAAIQWSVTGVVTPATAKYSVRLRLEKISPGP